LGLRGPAPKPRALRELEGNRGKRPLSRYEPQPVVKRPRCPAHLDADARREWRRLVPILERMRVLTEADEIPLANLCMQYATMVKAQRLLEKSGLLFKTKSGYIQQSPLVAIVSNSVEQVNKLCREFGLTPAARTRLTVDKQDVDPRDRLLRIMCQPWPPEPDSAEKVQ
jgi:P27 family predicted phage terminase small subunit